MTDQDNTETASDLHFSHVLQVSDLPKSRPYDFDLSLDAAALAGLAEDLNILGLQKLRFSGALAFDDYGDLVLNAELGVTATQACVVSLEPVKTRIDADVTRRFTKDLEAVEDDHQMQIDEDENRDPLGSEIDLGLILAESIALELPPFPRKDGAELKESVFAAPGVAPLRDEDTKPFAGLASLKQKLSDKS